MSQWARNHPDEMCEIACLPPSQQNEALRVAQPLRSDWLERYDHNIDDFPDDYEEDEIYD
jgi:hypothetical protein